MANTLLAAGASPAMVRPHLQRRAPQLRFGTLPAKTLLPSPRPQPQAHSVGEVEDFVGIASALLINVGTLSDDWWV
jgi:hydroxyethylthiazole kinase-like sugar kinase family protein